MKARGREDRIIAIGLLAAQPIVGGAVMAWGVRVDPDLTQAALGYVGTLLLGILLVMVSSAYAHVLRLGRVRGVLELLLTALLRVARVVIAVALVVTALALTSPRCCNGCRAPSGPS